MTIEDIKQELNNHIGDKVIIKHNLGRNKVEKYEVIIKELYNYVFTVETNGEEKEVKSFSYTDIITKTIKIDY
ncbi:MAG: hypothetical protein GX247_05125 [Mollicutes bacterium]|jgi:uncharacterized protein Veg|nr:hypothetical protein [Mollicutes bacterium]